MYLDTILLTTGISVGLSTITVTLKCFQDDIKIYRKVKCEIRKKARKGYGKGRLLPSSTLSTPLSLSFPPTPPLPSPSTPATQTHHYMYPTGHEPMYNVKLQV